jgi:hypothetical protein
MFSFQTLTKADDIRDFQIEGMSIGDSALDYFSKNELNNAHDILDYKNKKFRYYFLSYKNSKTYEFLQITVIPSDKEFKVQGIDGHILYENNINECYEKMEKIKKELIEILNKEPEDDQGNHPKFKNSKYKRSIFRFRNGIAELVCYDMDDKTNKTDRFAITLKNNNFAKFLTNEAYN